MLRPKLVEAHETGPRMGLAGKFRVFLQTLPLQVSQTHKHPQAQRIESHFEGRPSRRKVPFLLRDFFLPGRSGQSHLQCLHIISGSAASEASSAALTNQFIRSRHIDRDPRIFDCQMCDYSSNRRDMVQRHILTAHTPNVRVQCSKCGNFYKNKAVLLAHYRKNQCPPSRPRRPREDPPI